MSQFFNKIKFDGKILTFYRIFIINIILSILTLGIYSFWGKTKIRKYTVSSYKLLDESFEYTGTGGELCKGFLKAILLLLIFYFITYGIFLLFQFLFNIDKNLVMLIHTISLYLIYFFVFFAVVYSATRYRMSRTVWRGVRGRLKGSAIGYAVLCVKRFVLNVITLGYLIPHSQIKTTSYMINNMSFGNADADFVGTPSNLIKINIITLILLPITLGISRFWYHAAFVKNMFENTNIASVTFVTRYTGFKFFFFKITNFLLIICTLGFALPFIVWRNARFFAQNVAIDGEIDTSHILQSSVKDGVLGEGVDQALDLETGLI